MGTQLLYDGDKRMRPIRTGIAKARIFAVLAPLALAGCVPGAYVNDYPQGGYYSGSGSNYYRGPYSNYNGYSGYYGSGYYGSSYHYRPRVVYYDHDHDDRDCRHESHRDRRQHDDRDRYDRDRYDRDRHDRDRHDRGRNRDDRDSDRAVPVPYRAPPPGAAPLRRTPRAAPPPASGPPPKAADTSKPCAGQRNCGSPGKTPEVRSERNSREYPGDRLR